MAHKAVFDKKRKFGVELEFFGVDHFELQYTLTEWGIPSKIELRERPSESHWTIGSDGSIRGEDPTELRSPILCGSEGLSQVKRALTLLNYLGCQVNDSCGLHVHQHVEDYTGRDVLSLLRLYGKFENVLDGLVDVSRREDRNMHCRSLLRDESMDWISSLDKTGKDRAIEITMNYGDLFRTRKDKINLCSYFKFGTIEFRHFGATTNINDVENWILLTQAMISRVKQTSISRELSSNPVLSEFLRVTGFAEYLGCVDPLMIQCRTWIQDKYAGTRRKKTVTNKVLSSV